MEKEIFDESFNLKEKLKGTKTIVSISGMDNLGKSTQANLLSERYPGLFSKPLHINQTSAFPKLKGKELSEWWFNPNNYKEFVDTMYHALAQRIKIAKECPEPIVVLDKGIDFYDTRVKATLLTLGVDEEEIVNLVKEAKQKYMLYNSTENLKLIITNPKQEDLRIRESEVTENEDVYVRYAKKNIELLNKKLNETKVFTPIIFIEGNEKNLSETIDLIHNSILSQISNKLDERNHFSEVEKITFAAREFFGKNLKLMVLGGSTAKGCFVKDYSDFDFYFVLDKIPHDKIIEFTNKLSQITKIHIGATFYSLDDLKNYNIDNRSVSSFYEIKKGKSKILYKEDGIDLFDIPISVIQKYDQQDIPNALNVLKRELYYSQNSSIKNNNRDDKSKETKESFVVYKNTAKVIKTLALLEKLLLRGCENKQFTYGYEDTFYSFGKIYSKKMDKLIESNNLDPKTREEYKKISNSLKGCDILYCIDHRDDPKVGEQIHNYALNVIKMLDIVGFKNSKRSDFEGGKKTK